MCRDTRAELRPSSVTGNSGTMVLRVTSSHAPQGTFDVAMDLALQCSAQTPGPPLRDSGVPGLLQGPASAAGGAGLGLRPPTSCPTPSPHPGPALTLSRRLSAKGGALRVAPPLPHAHCVLTAQVSVTPRELLVATRGTLVPQQELNPDHYKRGVWPQDHQEASSPTLKLKFQTAVWRRLTADLRGRGHTLGLLLGV